MFCCLLFIFAIILYMQRPVYAHLPSTCICIHLHYRKMDIYFPSFKLDQTYHMDQLLQDLGIKDLFSYKADLSHLTNHKFVKISQVKK